MSSRVTRHELFMGIAQLYSLRATCNRGKVGAVAIRDGRIVAAGYNGAPAGRPHCLEVGCHEVGGHCVRAVHAEANLVAWSARTGTILKGAGIFTTTRPCNACMKLLLNAGIVGIVYRDEYNEEAPPELYDIPTQHYESVREETLGTDT